MMYFKPEHLFFLPISAACLLSSCISEIPNYKNEERGAELKFTTEHQQVSRATTTNFDKFVVGTATIYALDSKDISDNKWEVENHDEIAMQNTAQITRIKDEEI